jgi:hypothetical protein
VVPRLSNNNVIKDFDSQALRCLKEAFGYGNVLAAWLNIIARMIVAQYNRHRTCKDRWLEYFSWMYWRTICGAYGYYIIGNNGMIPIKTKHDNMLLAVFLDDLPRQLGDSFRAADINRGLMFLAIPN